MNIKAPLEQGSKIKRKIFRMVRGWRMESRKLRVVFYEL